MAAIHLADPIVSVMGQLAFGMPETVQSVVPSHRNGPLIASAAQLWINDDDTVLDITYGRGLFWTEYRPARLIAHDLYHLDGVDFRSLPEGDASVDVVVFDPPYLARGGVATSTVPGFLTRYGLNSTGADDSPDTVEKVQTLMVQGISEAHRVLQIGGRLLVKCMDFVTSGRFQPMRHFVVSESQTIGFEQVDEFVHYSGTGPGVWPRQVHSRRAHSFLCVFRKVRP